MKNTIVLFVLLEVLIPQSFNMNNKGMHRQYITYYAHVLENFLQTERGTARFIKSAVKTEEATQNRFEKLCKISSSLNEEKKSQIFGLLGLFGCSFKSITF